MSRVHLGRRLVLEAPEQVSDGAGGFATVWNVLGTVWAEVKAGAGREAGGVETVLSATAYRITLRAVPVGMAGRPEAGHRLRDASRVFRIDAVAERDARGAYLTCFATEEVWT
ncbi:head-tail adaptor protein [Paragemmobacter straminiformis]|uniref:Head-tail adaptor protein n=1 Tax=Paragemmobacter straminiformis TaxID=2045119 RepID=A0A842I700_9RHOB|nr:head-tail adaptor protein [Gemmobacter straminiformis]MBC2835852.1 head-tail adaptor protein [Gemmobacter straminiformis]